MAFNYGIPTYGAQTGREQMYTSGGYMGMPWEEFTKIAPEQGLEKFTLPDDPGANPFYGINPASTGQSYYIGSDPTNDKHHIIMVPGADGTVTQMSAPKNNPGMMKAIAAAAMFAGGAAMLGPGLAGSAGAGSAGAAGAAEAGGLGSIAPAAGGELVVDTAGMGLTGPGGIGSAGSLAGQGIAGWGAGAEGAAAAAGLGSLGADQGANEWAKLLRQDAAPPGSLLNTGLPTIDTTGGAGFMDKLGNLAKDPSKLAKLGQAIGGLGKGLGGGGGAGGYGGDGGPIINPRTPEAFQPVELDQPYLNPTVDPLYAMKGGGEPLYWGQAKVRKLAEGGAVQPQFGVDEKQVKAIRAQYRSKQAAINDMSVPNSVISKLGIRDKNAPSLQAAFGYTAKQGKKKAKETPFANFGNTKKFAQGGGIASLGDGMSDSLPTTINGQEPAALSDGEYVIPADVVSHLGNGSTDAGVAQLDNMLSRIRKARTGNPQQGRRIDPMKLLPE